MKTNSMTTGILFRDSHMALALKPKRLTAAPLMLALTCFGLGLRPIQAASVSIIGWNDLGMHCMDGLDDSVFSILPPYNTIHAQVIQNGRLLTATNGLTVTYEAVADPSGSINTTSQGKVNFWDYAAALYGANLAPDVGLAGFAMPGTNNLPQAMAFDTAAHWYTATGIPIVPYDDADRKNPYPMMRLTVRDSANTVLATNAIVLPVSDEMNCQACHLSGSPTGFPPAAGWLWNCDPVEDYRLNILQLHDDLHLGSDAYATALVQAGYNTNGLVATVTRDAKPILCARCHASNALPGTGLPGIPPLTRSVHAMMATAIDPDTGQPLSAAENRAACYRCHPGSQTQCLRGAMREGGRQRRDDGHAVPELSRLDAGCGVDQSPRMAR